MLTREIIAYLMIAAMVVSLGAVWFYLTRERRHYNRAHRAAKRTRAQDRAEPRLADR